MTVLSGHVSPETAYVVEDYPYSFTLRCKIRYWIEFKPKLGCRFVSQTTNPKRGHTWNKPKAGTYARFGMAMFLDCDGKMQHTGLSEYSDGNEARDWKEKYFGGVPDEAQPALTAWVAAKLAYDANREKGDPLHIGLKEAHEAFAAAKKAE